MKTKIKIFAYGFLLLCVLSFFAFEQYAKAEFDHLRVYFFDVGQGDAILVRTPDKKDILIDGGPDDTILERLGEALPFWDRHIDIVILTHPHADHINGLYEVLKRYKVGMILESNLEKNPESMNYFNDLAYSLFGGDIIASPVDGDKIILDNNIGIEFFYPFETNLKEKDLNDTSLLFKLSYGEIDFLFTGDATEKLEKRLLEHNIESEFLKVGHHGSRYSSSSVFLEAVNPTFSIISVGEDNRFGHPTKDALDRISLTGSGILRTDKNGSIVVEVFDSGGWRIECSKGCG